MTDPRNVSIESLDRSTPQKMLAEPKMTQVSF